MGAVTDDAHVASENITRETTERNLDGLANPLRHSPWLRCHDLYPANDVVASLPGSEILVDRRNHICTFIGNTWMPNLEIEQADIEERNAC